MTDDRILASVNRWLANAELENNDYLRDEELAFAQFIGGRRREEDDLPFKGASNLDIGGMVTFAHVESIHSRTMFALEKSRPLVTYSGENRDAVTQANLYLNQKLDEEVAIIEFADEWFHDAVIGGCRRAKACWEEETQRVAETWRIPIPKKLSEQAVTDEHIRLLLLSRLSSQFKELKVTERTSESWTITFEREGKLRKATVKWSVDGSVISATVAYQKTTFRGVRVYQVNPEDFWKAIGTIQACEWIIHRVWLTWNQLVQRVKAGKYKGIDISPDSADRVYAKRREDSTVNVTDLEHQRNQAAGVSPTPGDPSGEFEVLECYVLADWKGDGILEDRLITILRDAKRIVRNVLRTEEGYPSRPFSEIITQRIPGKSNYGFGVPRMIREAADEETAIHNLTVDASMLMAFKAWLYSGGQLKAEQQRLHPGRLVNVPNPATGDLRSSFLSLDFNVDLNPLISMQGRIDQLTQSVDGVGETQLMRKPSPRTASQSAMVQNELNIRFQRIFSRCMGNTALKTGLAGLIAIIAELYAAYGDPVEIATTTGKYAEVSFPKADKLTLRLNVDSSKLNEQREQQRMQTILGTVANPMNMQLGIVTPQNLYNALRDMAAVLGVKEINDYYTEPPKERSKPVDAKRENVLLTAGVWSAPHPADDDMQHYFEHRSHMDALSALPPELANPQALAMLEQHNVIHQQQHQAKQRQAAAQSQSFMPDAMPLGNAAAPVGGPGAGQPEVGMGTESASVQPAGTGAY